MPPKPTREHSTAAPSDDFLRRLARECEYLERTEPHLPAGERWQRAAEQAITELIGLHAYATSGKLSYGLGAGAVRECLEDLDRQLLTRT